MSWFGTNPFDETVERATSELLPAGQEDMALFLEICDQVRSKQVAPKDAARSLRKRIGHKNPNVQILALKLTDSVVKNGGHHFLVQLASREFMEEMESVIRQPATNSDVKSRSLGHLQSWATAFHGKSDLSYVAETVLRLKADHFIFPEISQGQSIMIDTAAPPDWTDSDVCMRCRTGFTMTNRKHHCRNCGQTFCRTCSSKNIPLPGLGINQDVRVCDGCYAKDWAKKNLTGSSSTASLNAIKSTPSSVSLSTSTNTTPPTRPADEEDEDLRRAIEASLKESNYRTNYSGDGGGGGGRGGYVPPRKSVPKPAEHPSTTEAKEQEDPDLAAAIAASLRETSIRSSASALRSTSSYGNASSDSYTPKYIPSNDLSSVEKENISMFSDLVKRIHEMGGDVAGDRQVQNLYEQIGVLQPKLVRSLEDAIGKHRMFIELHEQISRAVKTYDRLLEERLSNAYASRETPQPQPKYGAPQKDPQSSSYLALGSHGGASTPPSIYPTAYPDVAPVGSASAPYSYGSNSRSFSSHSEHSQPTAATHQVPASQRSQPPHPHFHAQHIPQQAQGHETAHTTSQNTYVAVPSSGSRIQPQNQSQYDAYYDSSQQPTYPGADPYPQYAQSQEQYQNQQAPQQQHQQHHPYPHPAEQYPRDQQQQHQQQLQQLQQQQHFEPKADDVPLIEF